MKVQALDVRDILKLEDFLGPVKSQPLYFSVFKVIPKNYFLDKIFCICCQIYLIGLLTKES